MLIRFTLATLLLAACGPSAAEPGPLNSAPLSDPTQRAATAAADEPACLDAQPFYWEIGDTEGVLASGTAGGDRYDPNDRMLVASASKWIFAAYVAERTGEAMTAATRDALRMRSGYVGLKSSGCRNSETVADCLADAGAAYDPSAAGQFDYDGGHFQKLAVDLGLGALDAGDLGDEVTAALGPDVEVRFTVPQPAGGMVMKPAAYAAFLRNLLAGRYTLSDMLGAEAVCTLPQSCDEALYSPAPLAWHYSLGHWVEDDATGDGAFSSAGLFGFYPWIDAEKKHYGLLARATLDFGASIQSALCGAAIRKAFFTPPATRSR